MAEFEEPLDSEEEPERLRRKWDAEEQLEIAPRQCSHCGKFVAGDSFFCMYCGERVFTESGVLGRLQQLLKQGQLVWIVLLVLAGFFLFSIF